MSWIERLPKPFLIKTGDGKTYTVFWLNPTQAVEFNVSEFEFPEVQGTLVSRGTSKGRKFNIEIYFQAENRNGVDHLDEADDFRVSANDPRPWTIEHPFYGTLLVQPIGLLFSNEELNVTKITGTVIETITNSPIAKVDPVDRILQLKEDFDAIAETRFVTITEPIMTTKNITYLKENVAKYYEDGSKKIKLTVDAEAYFNAFNLANSWLDRALQYPTEAIRATQSFINAPFLFIDTVQNRIALLNSQFNLLRETIVGLTNKADKVIYENNSTALLSAMVASAVVNYNFSNRGAVVSVIETIAGANNLLIEDLDSLQSENGGSVDSYIPDAEILSALSGIVNYGISNLFVIAAGAKQERILDLADDTNVIMLAHKIYGLKPDDSTITQIIDDNNIKLNELLGLKKGRRIIWYV